MGLPRAGAPAHERGPVVRRGVFCHGSLRYLPRRLFIRVSPRVKWRGESTGNRAYIVGAGSLFFPSRAWTAARHAGPPRRRRRRVSFVNLCFGNPPPSLLGRPAPACDSSCYSTVIRWGDSGGGEYWLRVGSTCAGTAPSTCRTSACRLPTPGRRPRRRAASTASRPWRAPRRCNRTP